MKKFLVIVLSALTGCMHNEPTPAPIVIYPSPTLDERTQIADQTCEVQYSQDKQNFLSAVQTVIRDRSNGPNLNLAPLETFREEINAAYNAVVMRCKTHMHCLEVKDYDEASCYMAASDRKDAERRFSDLA